MKTTILLSLISTAVVALSQPAWAGGVVAVVSTEEVSVVVSAAVALVLAVFVAALWLPNPLQAESGAAVVALALAVPVLRGVSRSPVYLWRHSFCR